MFHLFWFICFGMCLEQANTVSFRFFVIHLNICLKGNNGFGLSRGINQDV